MGSVLIFNPGAAQSGMFGFVAYRPRRCQVSVSAADRLAPAGGPQARPHHGASWHRAGPTRGDPDAHNWLAATTRRCGSTTTRAIRAGGETQASKTCPSRDG